MNAIDRSTGEVRPVPRPRRGTPARRSLSRQVERARFWLPLTIVGIVLLFELGLVTRLDTDLGAGLRLAFYSIMGPLATVLTLSWIAREVRGRERAQVELAETYRELQESHGLLSSIQRVTERFAGATDLEEAVRAAAEGLRVATGAQASAVVLGVETRQLVGEEGMNDDLRACIHRRDEALRRGAEIDEAGEGPTGARIVLSAPIRLADRVEGSVHAVFPSDPGRRAREAFDILASEFASVAEAARSRMRDLLTLFEVDRSIRAEGNLDRLLGTLLERTLSRVDASRGAVFLADEGPLLNPRAVRPEEDLAPLRMGEDRLARLALAGGPQLVGDLDASLRAEGGGVLAGMACAVVLPLTAEDELLGVLVMGHERKGSVREAQLPFLSLLAGQVSLAVRNARAYLHGEELAINEERARIAREIHDGVAQSLAFAALKIDLARKLVARDPSRAEDELELAGGTVRESIREVRRSIFALRPVDLERHGFVETVRRYALDFGEQNGVQVDVEIGEVGDLEVRSEAVLFRIFQEAMHNVAKHAGARSVRVRLGRDHRMRAFVEVTDDGSGFDVDAVADRVTSAGGLGLRQMRERVEARGGVYEIHSGAGEGTTVRASVY
jgi:signal transduction histidine kinase